MTDLIAPARPATAGVSRAFSTAVALVWLLATIPMLDLGYGSDVDAWLVADRAGDIWSSGTYLRSRSTGFPMYELAATPLVHFGGWRASNSLALIGGLAILILLVRLARRGVFRHPSIAIIAFMFLPVMIKNSTSTMDYVPALALLIASLVALVEERPYVCAVLIGIACGFRPTSGLFIVPSAVFEWWRSGQKRRPVAMIAFATCTGLAAFSPSLRLGGFGIARTTPFFKGVYSATKLFGLAQTIALCFVFAAMFWQPRRELLRRPMNPFLIFHVVNLLVWSAVFIALPDEPEYLLPAALSVVLLIDMYASRRLFAATAAILLSYHVVALKVAGTRGGTRHASIHVAAGYTIDDVNDRRFKMWLREAAANWRSRAPTLFMEQLLPPVVGRPGWIYDEEGEYSRQMNGSLAVSQRITDPARLEALHAKGFTVVVWSLHEWEYQLPETAGAHRFVVFVDDPGQLFGLPVRGRPNVE
jgi:hypothetical protein